MDDETEPVARLRLIRTVVIADDDAVYQGILSEAFRRRGFRPRVFADGLAAWDYISRHDSIFMVVANWMLPGLDGHTICRRLAAQGSPVQTVLMVGRPFLVEAQSTLAVQAACLLGKPFDKDSVDDAVEVTLAMASGSDGFAAVGSHARGSR